MNLFLRAFIVCLLAPLFAVAQNNYARINYLGSSKSSRVTVARIDEGGNAYVVINTSEDLEVRGMTFIKRGSNYSVITKVAANGTLQWARTLLVNSGADLVTDLQVDKDQNVYLAGYGTDIKPDNGAILNPGPFLIKLNKAGETLWSIGPDDNQGQVTTPGLIALTNGGLYWSAGFIKRLRIQSRNIPANDQAGGTPDAFVARVTADGQISGVYHHPVQGAVVQVLQATKTGNAAAVINANNVTAKVMMDQQCAVISEKPFFKYGSEAPIVQATSSGYRAFAYSYDDPGYMDAKLDDELNVTSATKVFPLAQGTADMVTGGIGFDASTSFYTKNNNGQQDWLMYDGSLTTLLAERTGSFDRQIYTRSFIKVVDDTVHMLIKHLDPATLNYSFYGQDLKDKTAAVDGYFWVKYVYKATDPCLKLTTSVSKNGIEGAQDAVIKIALPDGCTATEDLTVALTEAKPADNRNDFVLPASITLKKGQNSATAIIKIVDDAEMEPLESFDIQLTLGTTVNAYKIASGPALSFTITDNDNTAANRVFNVSYQAQMNEGASADITVSLLPNIKLTEALNFTFEPDGGAYQAGSGTDHTPIQFSLPAGSNSVTFKVNALTDKLIEGDEFISGKIVAKTNGYGAFTSSNNAIKIKITDADNTADKRVIDITPPTNTLNEGSANTYLLKIASGYSAQNPLTINTQQQQWQAFIQQTTAAVQLSDAVPTAALSIGYPDDNVIRGDKSLKLALTASDAHTGTYRFRWNGQFVDALTITAVDNDVASAKLTISPAPITIREGQPGNLAVQVADGKVFENDIVITYSWAGANVNADERIVNKGPMSLTLPKAQNKLSIPISVGNDQKINPFNNYGLNFTAKDASGKTIALSPANIAVNIVDDDASNLKIPLVFTPNGDGVNDVWNIEGLSLDAQAKVSIFDRSGGLLFQSNGYGTAWDGTTKGSPLPPGTYYYRIIGFTRSMAGSVTIIR